MQGVRKVITSSFYLMIFQLINILAPFLAIPIISRSLSVEEFGAVMLALSGIVFANVITDYGYSFSANYNVSVNRDNKVRMDEILSTATSTKFILVGIAVFSYLSFPYIIDIEAYKSLFFIGSFAIIGQAYQQPWFFQGLERMELFTLYNSIIKLIYLLSVWVLLKENGDGEVVVGAWAVANIIGAIISTIMIYKLGYRLKISKFNKIKSDIISNFHYFIARLSVACYTSAAPMIMGSVSLHQASLYSVADQGYKAGQTFTSAISQALYPNMARHRNWLVFKKLFIIGLSFLSTGAALVYSYREDLIIFIFSERYVDSAEIFSILLIALLINYAAVLFGYPAFAAFNDQRIPNTSVIVASLIFITVTFFIYIIGNLNSITLAKTIVFIEATVFIIRALYLKRFLYDR